MLVYQMVMGFSGDIILITPARLPAMPLLWQSADLPCQATTGQRRLAPSLETGQDETYWVSREND
jgi:hypothetical protein